jgi:hypothetical protein
VPPPILLALSMPPDRPKPPLIRSAADRQPTHVAGRR